MEHKKGIVDINIEDSIKVSYLDYAMSVIVGRALPDVRDGLKPVHRRALYSMNEMGLVHNKSYKKSARVVGDVIGKFHPHGDSAVYDTIVRLAQNFSMRYPLVDGQGNFGSVDGDSAAAMRYTEIRLTRIADELMADLDKNTVDFNDNYDGSMQEPSVFPTKVPNLLVNGSSGIAVGMATNIPPHNLTEVINALLAMLDDPDITDTQIFEIITGPDFPTSGIIMGRHEIFRAYQTGRGSIRVRSKTHVEQLKNNKEQIIVTELPYQVNKSYLIEKIADLVREKKVTAISDLRDESDRDGIRVVIELKKGEIADVVLNQLFKYTTLETSFGINMVALIGGKPQTLPLMTILEEFIKHRVVVVIRRTQFLLDKAEARLHILEGLKIAVENIDEVVAIIKQSPDTPTAKSRLMERFELSDIQSQAILDMRLAKLTGLEIDKLNEEYNQILKDIEYYRSILGSRAVLNGVIRTELVEVRDTYGDERRTVIEDNIDEILIEDLIPDDDVVITLTHNGYIKRTQLSTYAAQKRGGKGKAGATYKGDDFVEDLIATTNHARVMFFTNTGKVHFLKGYEIPEGSRDAKGRHISNLLELEAEEYLQSVLVIGKTEEDRFIFMGTKHGVVKKTPVSDFKSGRSGMIALKLRDDDEIVSTQLTTDKDFIFIATTQGKVIQFKAGDVRSMGRVATGVRGISLDPTDVVVSMGLFSGKPYIINVTTKGFGKRTPIEDYRVQARGGKGIKLCKINNRTGTVSRAAQVGDDEDVMLITRSGKVIRTPAVDISILGRDTQGVRLMNTGGDEIISFVVVSREEEEPEEI